MIERSDGIWNRAIVAGVKQRHLLVSHFVQGCIVLSMQLMTCCLFVYTFVVGTASFASMSLIFLIYALSGVFGIVTGFLIPTFFDDLVASVFFNLGAVFSHLFLSGVFWPIEGQPILLQLLSRLLSFYYPAAAVRSIAFKDASIGDYEVIMAVVLMLTWIVIVCGLVLSLTARRQKRS
jgi:ABC-type polysaccharide/polyol phosphate export permease